VACLCAFAAYFALIPSYSFVGAAIGTVVAEVAALACMLVGLRRAGRPLPSLINPVKALLSGGAAAMAMIFLGRFGLPWLASLGVGGAVYLVSLALTRAIPREIVLNALRRRRVVYQGSA